MDCELKPISLVELLFWFMGDADFMFLLPQACRLSKASANIVPDQTDGHGAHGRVSSSSSLGDDDSLPSLIVLYRIWIDAPSAFTIQLTAFGFSCRRPNWKRRVAASADLRRHVRCGVLRTMHGHLDPPIRGGKSQLLCEASRALTDRQSAITTLIVLSFLLILKLQGLHLHFIPLGLFLFHFSVAICNDKRDSQIQ